MYSIRRTVMGILIPAIFYWNQIQAGSLRPYVFDTSGKQIFETLSSLDDRVLSFGKVDRRCADKPDQICIYYDIVVGKGLKSKEIIENVTSALNSWTNLKGIDLQLGLGEVHEVDGLFPPSLDASYTAGNFIVSFVSPTEKFEESKQTLSVFSVVELKEPLSEIKHSTIYLNPEGITADTQAALMNGIGQSLGLASSAIRSSLMSDELLKREGVFVPSADDVQWLRYLYGNQDFHLALGSLSGRVVNGKSRDPWSGAHLGLLQKKDMLSFTQTLNRDLLVASTFSDRKGAFIFPSIPPGDYVVIAEPRVFVVQGLVRFNPVLDLIWSKDIFEPEFYDGAERESNREAAYGFSPQAIQYAAIVHIVSGKETSKVELITNIGDEKGDEIRAAGSSHETLSSIKSVVQEFKGDPNASQNPVEGLESGGGCNLSQSVQVSLSFFILSLIFVLCLFFLRQQGLRVKSSRFPCRQSEQSDQSYGNL